MNADNKRSPFLPLAIFGVLFSGMILAFQFFADPPPESPSADEVDLDIARDSGQDAAGEAAGEASLSNAAKPLDLDALDEVTLETDRFKATFNAAGAALRSLEIKEERYAGEEEELAELVTTWLPEYLPFRQRIEGARLPEVLVYSLERSNDHEVVFRAEADGLALSRKVNVREGDYQLYSTLRIENKGDTTRSLRVVDEAHHYVLRVEEESSGIIARPSPWIGHGFCKTGADYERLDRDDLETAFSMGPDVRFAALENTYFVLAMLPESAASGTRCELFAEDRGGTSKKDAEGALFTARLYRDQITLAPGESALVRTQFYAGPKELDALTAVGNGLDDVVDLGWFGFIGFGLIQLLSFIYGYVGEWGIAIALLTLIVKILLYPLTEKSFQSMARMRLLKPEMDRINELYQDDREKKGAAIMELYKKHGVNPLAGCLPSLLQMPIWFALYQSLSTNIQLYHASGLWFDDLSSPDPGLLGIALIKPLPLALGGLMIVQQRISPAAMDPIQAKMMMIVMPTMITLFMYFLPAGLCVYMVTNSVLGIGQQYWIQKRLERQHPPQEESEDPDAEPSADESAATTIKKSRPGKASRKGARSRRNRGGRS